MTPQPRNARSDLSLATILAVAAWCLVALAGVAIGATSIGGVLVVPALHRLLGLTLNDAIAVSSLAFLCTGLWALWRLPRMGWDTMRQEWVWLAAALGGAMLGVWISHLVPSGAIHVWVGVLACASGLYGLWRAYGSSITSNRAWPGRPMQALLGGVVGLGSALSGTGGPVMLLPLLMLRQYELSRSVQLGLILQAPIAVAATSIHAAAGRLDWEMGLLVAVVLLICAELGRRLSRHGSPRVLQTITAVLLLSTSSWMFLIG